MQYSVVSPGWSWVQEGAGLHQSLHVPASLLHSPPAAGTDGCSQARFLLSVYTNSSRKPGRGLCLSSDAPFWFFLLHFSLGIQGLNLYTDFVCFGQNLA